MLQDFLIKGKLSHLSAVTATLSTKTLSDHWVEKKGAQGHRPEIPAPRGCGVSVQGHPSLSYATSAQVSLRDLGTCLKKGGDGRERREERRITKFCHSVQSDVQF